MPTIDPSFLTSTAEWGIGAAADAPSGATGGSIGGGDAGIGGIGGGEDFGSALGRQIERLTSLQDEAATASRQLATGQASDPTAVVMSVERARLAMQLAGQLRTKGVEAVNDIFHTQV